MGYRNFFRINLPYGMKKTPKGWHLFNRHYKPLGWSSPDTVESVISEPYDEFFEKFTSNFPGMTNSNLRSIFKNGERVDVDENGDVCEIWFYNDKTNPANDPKQFERYFEILRRLSAYETK